MCCQRCQNMPVIMTERKTRTKTKTNSRTANCKDEVIKMWASCLRWFIEVLPLPWWWWKSPFLSFPRLPSSNQPLRNPHPTQPLRRPSLPVGLCSDLQQSNFHESNTWCFHFGGSEFNANSISSFLIYKQNITPDPSSQKTHYHSNSSAMHFMLVLRCSDFLHTGSTVRSLSSSSRPAVTPQTLFCNSNTCSYFAHFLNQNPPSWHFPVSQMRRKYFLLPFVIW